MRIQKKKIFLIKLFFLTAVIIYSGKYNDYIYFEKGDMPLIFTVPHDGSLSIDNLLERQNKEVKDFVLLRDINTRIIAEEASKLIYQKTNKKPFLVINLLDRKYMDPNRSPKDAYENIIAEEVYIAFHNKIIEYIKDIQSKYDMALLIDIHGQSNEPADVYIGTREGSSIKKLIDKYGESVLNGEYSINKQLSNFGFCIPGFNDYIETDWVSNKKSKTISKIYIPKKIPLSLKGGYIVKKYSTYDKINTIQLEVHRRIRIDKENRDKFINAFSNAVIIFVEKYLFFR